MNSAVCLLDRAAGLHGDKIAVEDENSSITYSQWRARARSVATALIGSGTGANRPVIVMLPKSVEALVCFMGVLYSGCPYVPVDVTAPASRLQKIIDNLSPAHIIADETTMETLSQCAYPGARAHMYDRLVSAEADGALVDETLAQVVDTDPIYVMYTSGSTGAPKGVTIAHRSILDYARWLLETFSLGPDDITAAQAPFYFDNSTFDIYGTLSCFGKLVLIPEPLLLFPLKLPEFLREKEITTFLWVPTVMINVANSGALDNIELPRLKTITFAGEVMPNLQLNIWRRAFPRCVFANMYGPTEITDICCYYIVDRPFADHDPLPIGKPCRNMRILILNDQNELCKPGEQGELCILGTGLSLGYWNAPDLSNQVFVQNPLNTLYHERMYRSGDLAYATDDGLIMFLGRRDGQIKVKGNRIELGEIETAAFCVPGVENCCALFDEQEQEIVLFVETGAEMPLRRFNQELRRFIPKYMLPSRLVTMERLPHTANDKLDRVTLRGMI